jgi:2-(1,2-epoxy-1,2-dihydrophenyl)acetyl-CoA isomerase
MTDAILYERSDGVATITLNRPDRLNALGADGWAALGEACLRAATDDAVRCVLVTGTGRGFCAGGDVKDMAAGRGNATLALNDSVDRLRHWHNETSFLLHTMPKPTIAAINGYAMGAGLSIALSCDLRLMADTAQLGTAFIGVALSGDFGGSWFMTRLIGAGRARELYFLGERVDAARAQELGLVSRVVAADELPAAARELAERLASGPTKTLGLMKQNLVLAESSDLQTLLDREALHQRITGESEDHQEAASAFVEKRRPKFVGR